MEKLLVNTGKMLPKVYKRRWVMLLIYFIIFPISTMQWTQFTLVANIIIDYYNVSYEAVNWTFLIAMINLTIFAFPSCYMVDKFGIRNGALFAMSGATLGAWIKFYATSSNNFWMIILGQMFLSVPQMCLIGIGPKLSVEWFGADELSIANSIGIVGLQLGYALGFVLPPMLVKKESAGKDLYNGALGLAIICTTALVIVLLFLQDKPPIPPSQATLKKSHKIQYLKSLKKLMKNTSYLLIVMVVGTNVAVLCLIQSLLNQIVLKYYETGEDDAGLMGLLMMVFCIIGCFSCGAILMKFKTYKLCYCVSNLLMGVTLIIFLNTLEIGIVFPYVAISLYGFFYGLFWNVSYEITVEFTYPEPEAITVGLIYTVAQTLSIGSIYLYSFLFYEVSDEWANNFLVISVLICFILTLCTRYNLKRAAANSMFVI